MLITTTENVPGYRTREILGVARGSTIRAKHLGKDIMAGLRNIVGGEIKSYTDMMNEARDEAMERMTQHARDMGADAVINVRLTTSQVVSGAAEILAYGTAVKLAK